MQILTQNTQMPRDSVQGNRPVFHEKAYQSRPGRGWGGTGVFNISNFVLPGETFLHQWAQSHGPGGVAEVGAM
jgi:hypothetical protein